MADTGGSLKVVAFVTFKIMISSTKISNLTESIAQQAKAGSDAVMFNHSYDDVLTWEIQFALDFANCTEFKCNNP